MYRAHQPGALRRLAVAALLAATVGILHAPAASALNEDGTATAASASDGDRAADARTRRADDEHAADRRDARASEHDEDGTAGTSGDTDDEQPLSTADENDGGANGDCSDTTEDEGEYCSTRDGSASENGAEGGEATGRPCAGCVGKADNKNPQGQLPNADEDGNHGYECDDNQGVGQGNPAHTGCASAADGGTADDGDVAGEDAVVDGEIAEDALGGAEVAGVEVLVARPADVRAAGAPGMPAAAGPLAAVLPSTGSGGLVGLAAVAGVVLLGAGLLLLRRRAHG